jgi:hypothetical protein
MTDISEMQDLHDRAVDIRDRAVAERRNLSPEEAAAIDNLLDQFRAKERDDWLGASPGRRTEPDQPDRAHRGDSLVDRAGNEIRIYAKGERLSAAIPARDRLAPSDLGACVYGMVSGDWSRVSERCLSIMGQAGTTPDSSGGFYCLPYCPTRSWTLCVIAACSSRQVRGLWSCPRRPWITPASSVRLLRIGGSSTR